MSNRSYAKIIASINAIRAIVEGLPGIEKRSILKDESDELLKLSKEAQKWAFILDSECRQLQICIEELENNFSGEKGKPAPPEGCAPNLATAWGGFAGKEKKN